MSESAADSPPPLWQVVPLAEYRLPAEPAQQVASRKLRDFWRLLRSDDASAQAPARAEKDLRALPEVRLEHLVPPVDWGGAQTALDGCLADWLRDDTRAVRFFVGPPGGGMAEALRHWAGQRGWPVIEPPTAEQVLAGDIAWLEDWPRDGEGWLLPSLERCYLRHPQGLALVRRLLEAVTAGRLGRGLVVCDSWAWAFLQRVWVIPQPEVYTLQAFDGERLSAYFLQLAHRGGRHLRVRNAHTGEDILPWPDTPSDEAEKTRAASAELRRLAAHCRGNLGVAWTYWRTHLRTEPDPEEAEAVEQTEDRQGEADTDTVWWSSGRAPVMPVETGDDLAFVLHALLLHNGLDLATLERLLPLSHGQLAAVVARLVQLGLVDQAGGRHRVARLGYAAAREFLRGRGYLVDAF
ncbi:MAG: hypothetical protein LPK58_10025 [Gammaproteobacteria bacterium]|mgnify:CR=1 FL=1|nr:hypothetical protein [Gammaproteobacteria bacterium]